MTLFFTFIAAAFLNILGMGWLVFAPCPVTAWARSTVKLTCLVVWFTGTMIFLCAGTAAFIVKGVFRL